MHTFAKYVKQLLLAWQENLQTYAFWSKVTVVETDSQRVQNLSNDLEMTDFTDEKQSVLTFLVALDDAEESEVTNVLKHYCSPDYTCRAMYPFNEMDSVEEVAEQFWVPLKTSIRSIQRRTDIFFAGRNEMDGFQSVWVASMGHLMGLFDAPWLGIEPTGKLVMLRFAEFHKVQNGKISESALFFDIPHLMMQAGLQPFPPQTAAHLVQPGPRTHDGVLLDEVDPATGEETLALINRMIKDLGQWQSGLPLEDELARTWHDDMLWWGPAGIGSTFTIERYAKQHAGPFRVAFGRRSKTKHLCRMAEGHYGGFFGWPNFTAEPIGGFMGMPATAKPGEFRVIDFYRREGDKLAENWIFIDLLHFWKGQGLDVLARMAEVPRT